MDISSLIEDHCRTQKETQCQSRRQETKIINKEENGKKKSQTRRNEDIERDDLLESNTPSQSVAYQTESRKTFVSVPCQTETKRTLVSVPCQTESGKSFVSVPCQTDSKRTFVSVSCQTDSAKSFVSVASQTYTENSKCTCQLTNEVRKDPKNYINYFPKTIYRQLGAAKSLDDLKQYFVELSEMSESEIDVVLLDFSKTECIRENGCKPYTHTYNIKSNLTIFTKINDHYSEHRFLVIGIIIF